MSGLSAGASALVYVPENLNTRTARVLVAIHGCLQTPEALALGTGWNLIAERENLVVIYPRVPKDSNPMDCWGWFDPENQRADSGQLFDIQAEIISWKKSLKISQAPVFAAGISSGAATVAGLLACFPDEFAGGAIHSGPTYGIASSLATGTQVLAQGPLGVSRQGQCDPGGFKKPLIVIHGSLDFVVNPLNVPRITTDFFADFEYTGVQNGEENSLFYSTYDYKSGAALMGRVVVVYGLGHAWSGYGDNVRLGGIPGLSRHLSTELPFFSLKGPNATAMIMDFFNSAGK